MSKYYAKITARFPGKCEVCGKELHEGDTIAWKRLGRHSYTRCLECMEWTPYTKERPRELFIAEQKQEAWDKAQRSWKGMTDHQRNEHEIMESM